MFEYVVSVCVCIWLVVCFIFMLIYNKCLLIIIIIFMLIYNNFFLVWVDLFVLLEEFCYCLFVWFELCFLFIWFDFWISEFDIWFAWMPICTAWKNGYGCVILLFSVSQRNLKLADSPSSIVRRNFDFFAWLNKASFI